MTTHPTCDALGRSGALWYALGRSGTLWDALGRSGTLKLWSALGRSGALWDARFRPQGTGAGRDRIPSKKWLDPSKTTDPSKSTPLNTLGRSGTLLDAMGGSGAFWDALGRSGTLWDALGRPGTLWGTLSRPYRDLIGCPRSQIIVWGCVSGPTLSRPYWVPYWVLDFDLIATLLGALCRK